MKRHGRENEKGPIYSQLNPASLMLATHTLVFSTMCSQPAPSCSQPCALNHVPCAVNPASRVLVLSLSLSCSLSPFSLSLSLSLVLSLSLALSFVANGQLISIADSFDSLDPRSSPPSLSPGPLSPSPLTSLSFPPSFPRLLSSSSQSARDHAKSLVNPSLFPRFPPRKQLRKRSRLSNAAAAQRTRASKGHVS